MENILGYKITDSVYPHMRNIESQRFILRPVDIEDVKDIYEYLSQEKVVKYLTFKEHKTIMETKKFVKSYFINKKRVFPLL